MSELQVLAYVQASSVALGLELDPQQAQRVATHLARTVAMARMLDGVPMTPEIELAEIYSPAAFKPSVDQRKQP